MFARRIGTIALLLCCFALFSSTTPARAHDGHEEQPSLTGSVFAASDTGTSKAPAKSAPDTKWDVNDPPGTEREISLDVRTGTWMSVDVSPDGHEILFDLLGDLYVMPVTGGEARAITSGRYHVNFEDIRALAHPVMRHRVLTNFHAQSEGITSDTLVDRLLEAVPVPRSGM